MRSFLLLISFIFLSSNIIFASHGDKKDEKKKEEPKKEGHKKEEHKKEEPKKEEPKKEEVKKKAPPEPKILRDYKEQEFEVKKLKSFIKADGKEIEKCKKTKDMKPEEKRACTKNVETYSVRIEKNKLRLTTAELKLRTMEKEAKKRIPPKPEGEKSEH